MKKIKWHFWPPTPSHPTPSHPIPSNLDTVNQKIEIAFKFTWKIPYKFIGPRTEFIIEFPLYFIWVQFTGKSFVFFFKKSTFRLILKNPTKRVFLIFLIRNPNLTKISNPQEICQDILNIYVYMSIVFNIS